MVKQIIVDENTYVIKNQSSVVINFPVDMTEEELTAHSFSLQLRGAVGIYPNWMYEGGLPYLYRDIDDALSMETDHSRFSLKIKAEGEGYPRRAYYRITCPPKINSQYAVPASEDVTWKFKGTVRTKDFQIGEGGAGEVRFECYLKKEGRDPRDISGEPDEVTVIPLPVGTRDWSQMTGEITIGADTAVVLVTIVVEKAVGTVWLEDFSLKNDTGFSILPPFDLTNRYYEFANWMGENLSEKEWTTLEVALNGQELGIQKLFQRCFAGAENEIVLPEGILHSGNNELYLKNSSEYFCPAPYVLSRLALHVEEVHPVQIIYCPEYVTAGEEFGILVRTVRENTSVGLTLPPVLQGAEKLVFEKSGLHVIRIQAGDCGSDMELMVDTQDCRQTARVVRIVEKENDGVVTGSGDAVYIPQEMDEMEKFFCWFLSGRLGNLITFRPVYRWCGSRACHPDVWKHMAELCNGLNIRYCCISDGRELPGINCNPSDEMLKGKYYLGSQGHERDGAFYYWLQTARQCNETLYEEVSRKICRHPDYTYRTPFEYGENDVYYNFSR